MDTPTIDMSSLARFIEAIDLLRERTGNQELQSQTILVFAYTAYRHPNEVPFQEAEKTLGLTQTSTSRNALYLSTGLQRQNQTNPKLTDTVGGYGLISVRTDPYYAKRKLISLTGKGIRLATELCRVLEAGKRRIDVGSATKL